MNTTVSPFGACNSAVNPNQFMKDCQYDACKCDDPIHVYVSHLQPTVNNAAIMEWFLTGDS